MKNLKLYVWEGVLTDYTDGLAIAFAESKGKAVEQLIQKGIPKGRFKGTKLDGIPPKVRTGKAAFFVFGGG